MSSRFQLGVGLALGMALVLVLVSPALPSPASVPHAQHHTHAVRPPAILMILAFAFLQDRAFPQVGGLAQGFRWRESGPELIDLTCSRLC